jgi:hypothetical protein
MPEGQLPSETCRIVSFGNSAEADSQPPVDMSYAEETFELLSEDRELVAGSHGIRALGYCYQNAIHAVGINAIRINKTAVGKIYTSSVPMTIRLSIRLIL